MKRPEPQFFSVTVIDERLDNDGEPSAESYSGIYTLLLGKTLRVVLVPTFDKHLIPWPPQEAKQLEALENSTNTTRLLCAIFADIAVTPDGGRVGQVENLDARKIYYVSPNEFNRFSAEARRFAEYGHFHKFDIRELKSYSLVRFIVKTLSLNNDVLSEKDRALFETAKSEFDGFNESFLGRLLKFCDALPWLPSLSHYFSQWNTLFQTLRSVRGLSPEQAIHRVTEKRAAELLSERSVILSTANWFSSNQELLTTSSTFARVTAVKQAWLDFIENVVQLLEPIVYFTAMMFAPLLLSILALTSHSFKFSFLWFFLYFSMFMLASPIFFSLANLADNEDANYFSGSAFAQSFKFLMRAKLSRKRSSRKKIITMAWLALVLLVCFLAFALFYFLGADYLQLKVFLFLVSTSGVLAVFFALLAFLYIQNTVTLLYLLSENWTRVSRVAGLAELLLMLNALVMNLGAAEGNAPSKAVQVEIARKFDAVSTLSARLARGEHQGKYKDISENLIRIRKFWVESSGELNSDLISVLERIVKEALGLVRLEENATRSQREVSEEYKLIVRVIASIFLTTLQLLLSSVAGRFNLSEDLLGPIIGTISGAIQRPFYEFASELVTLVGTVAIVTSIFFFVLLIARFTKTSLIRAESSIISQ
jgi:hypothetical protein